MTGLTTKAIRVSAIPVITTVFKPSSKNIPENTSEVRYKATEFIKKYLTAFRNIIKV